MILSIIIPHKNSSALLERLLMSIPSNDEFEVIVVDDNSKKCEKENLCKIVSTYKFHIKYLQPIITQYFIDNKSEIWLLFLIAHSKR